MAKSTKLTVPTEPIGSIPRPIGLIERVAEGDSEDANLAPLYEGAIRNTNERFEATGVGLRICRSIVESRGGRLWSADNSPCCAGFYFTLPAKVEAQE